MSHKSVIGIIPTLHQAEGVVDRLRAAGFMGSDISALFPDRSGTMDFAHEKSTKAPEGATAGGMTGGLLGGTFGWLCGIGALAIPGLGPFIVAGPLMAALGGMAVGGAIGGLTGALIGFGLPEYEAKRYEGIIREGNILISVHTEKSAEITLAMDILTNGGANDVAAIGESIAPKSVEGMAAAVARTHIATS